MSKIYSHFQLGTHSQHRWHGRRHGGELAAFPHPGEEEQIEEVHAAEHEQHDAHLATERFKHTLGSDDVLGGLQIQRDEADVDEVEADHEQVVHTVGQFRVSLETFDQEDATVFVQGSCDPDGHGDGEYEVEGIAKGDGIHNVG